MLFKRNVTRDAENSKNKAGIFNYNFFIQEVNFFVSHLVCTTSNESGRCTSVIFFNITTTI